MFRIKNRLSVLIAATLVSCSQWAGAQSVGNETDDIRPVSSSWMAAIGSSHLADTYLSPLKYSGWSSTIMYDRMQVARWGNGNWNTKLNASVNVDRGENPARNADMWAMLMHFSWGTTRTWQLPLGVKAGIGPAIHAEAGCLYNSRNSNNPASAKGALTIDAIAFASKRLCLGRLPVTLSYQAAIPVIGAFFSPRYDELYYEIYLGNHKHLVHTAWWGNRWAIDNLLCADLNLGSTSLRLGYRCYWMNSSVNNLVTRVISHQFVIGFTTDWLSVKTSRRLSGGNAKINTAF